MTAERRVRAVTPIPGNPARADQSPPLPRARVRGRALVLTPVLACRGRDHLSDRPQVVAVPLTPTRLPKGTS